ncbi:MAG TPA: hypothetical protein DCY13_01025 [Verrucomicrobiales bacterium]|nr:hypothetical protein [Verrucomicrobiales bacterium]
MATQSDFSRFLRRIDGFTHPDWEAIAAAIENQPADEWPVAWKRVSRMWVDGLRDDFGGGYRVHESANFLILTTVPDPVAAAACRFCESALQTIMTGLKGAASDAGYGHHVVLCFDEMDDYYSYIAQFYPDGDHPMTGGVCLGGGGYVHLALPTKGQAFSRGPLVHELTHACLVHLPLPTWLNEALAMKMEAVICGGGAPPFDRELYDQHVRHWNGATIQQFWSGESWGLAGDGFTLSYSLADILWRKIEVDLRPPKPVLIEFISKANSSDAGQAASRELFGVGLEDVVEDFLGPGQWMPAPESWPGELEAEKPETPAARPITSAPARR